VLDVGASNPSNGGTGTSVIMRGIIRTGIGSPGVDNGSLGGGAPLHITCISPIITSKKQNKITIYNFHFIRHNLAKTNMQPHTAYACKNFIPFRKVSFSCF